MWILNVLVTQPTTMERQNGGPTQRLGAPSGDKHVKKELNKFLCTCSACLLGTEVKLRFLLFCSRMGFGVERWKFISFLLGQIRIDSVA